MAEFGSHHSAYRYIDHAYYLDEDGEEQGNVFFQPVVYTNQWRTPACGVPSQWCTPTSGVHQPLVLVGFELSQPDRAKLLAAVGKLDGVNWTLPLAAKVQVQYDPDNPLSAVLERAG